MNFANTGSISLHDVFLQTDILDVLFVTVIICVAPEMIANLSIFTFVPFFIFNHDLFKL